jgi:hypothetical protein
MDAFRCAHSTSKISVVLPERFLGGGEVKEELAKARAEGGSGGGEGPPLPGGNGG